jgi:phosphoglycolate phosphatase-like HAD superfamily hydrolase
MRLRTTMTAATVLAVALVGWPTPTRSQDKSAPSDALPSWNDGPAKKAVLDFVARVTKEGGPDYVKPELRVACFDNDGTLWCERPIYFQFEFAMHRVKVLAPKHPEWKTTEPFKSALADDVKGMLAHGEKGLTDMMMAGHAGMTPQDFDLTVRDWLASTRHPRFHRPYNELVYQPMLEVLAYVRQNGFKTFIVSGGGNEFMRVWAEKAYGIPPEQIVGTTIKTKFELKDGKPTLIRLPQVDFIDDGPGKPVGIQQYIGRRPILTFGNSDGDLQMLQWTTAGAGPRLGLIVHHTDAEREYAYDRDSPVGRLDKAWDQAKEHGWIVIDMKKEWKVIFPFQK